MIKGCFIQLPSELFCKFKKKFQKNNFFFVARPLRERGGKGPATKKKNFFTASLTNTDYYNILILILITICNSMVLIVLCQSIKLEKLPIETL